MALYSRILYRLHILLLPVSESRLSTSSLPHFLSLLLAYALIWQPPAANRRRAGSSFKTGCVSEEQGGNCKEKMNTVSSVHNNIAH